MYPTLFTIGRFSISTYTVLLDLGLILGLVLAYSEGKRLLRDGESVLDLGLWLVLGGIAGGRAGFVVANWSVFAEDWVRTLRIWEGGLSFHGAFVAGLVVMAVFAGFRYRERLASTWLYADAITPGLALGITFGWAACLMGGCAYGALGQGFGHAFLPDIYGVEAYRFATQAAGLAFALLLFVGLWLLRGRWPFPGASFLTYVLVYFAGHVFLEFTRGDEAPYLGALRLSQVFDLAFVLAAGLGLLALWWALPPQPDPGQTLEEAPAPDQEAAAPARPEAGAEG
ncbi:MAG: prolipoprotein diacylglyceryl transferase [Anaerolineae bacterium]|nr:prolipoprotein diacylglyceryl transferase [Anaerolineae bacterium]